MKISLKIFEIRGERERERERLWILSRSDKTGLISLRVPRIAFKGERMCTFGHARYGQCETIVFSSYMANRLTSACTCNTMYLFLFVREFERPFGSAIPSFCFLPLVSPDEHARGARRTLIAINYYALACLSRVLLHYTRGWPPYSPDN